jgi:hypothetical protein
MKITIRIDSTNSEHTHFTIFQDGGNCGQLCMNTREASIFINRLYGSTDFTTKVLDNVA